MPEPRESKPGNRARIHSERIDRIAARQWDVIGHRQLRRCGLGDSAIFRWVRSGRLHRMYPGVYSLGHPPRRYESQLAAALIYLGPGAALSHLTALWWWDLLRFRPNTIHVSSARQRRPLGIIALHRPSTIERVFRRRLPVTPIARALVESAPLLAPNELRRTLAQAEFKRGLKLDEVEALLGKGHRGSAALRAALQNHLPQLAHTKSDLEDDFIFLCERFGIPLPQVNIKVAGWEIDAYWPEVGVAVELDGSGNHGTEVFVARDRRKELALRQAGLAVVRYSADQVARDPEAVAADAVAVRAAGAELAA
jgi:hypothetical protein